MSADGTTIDLALSAFFELCVPLVSDGRLERTFATNLIAPLTDEEKEEYAATIQDSDQAWRILSADGLILFEIKQAFCRIITVDGNPNVALARFRDRLASAVGTETGTEQTSEGWERVIGRIDLGDGFVVAALFVGDMTNPNAGFFASAFLLREKKNG